MARERSIIQFLVKNILHSLKPKRAKKELVGEDFYGTKYYEQKFSADSQRKNRPARHFEPVNKEDFTQEIPAEWEAWLRHRRATPPTKEEIAENYHLAMLKKKNAAELEAAYEKEKAGLLESNVPSERTKSTSFPVHEDYKQKT